MGKEKEKMVSESIGRLTEKIDLNEYEINYLKTEFNRFYAEIQYDEKKTFDKEDFRIKEKIVDGVSTFYPQYINKGILRDNWEFFYEIKDRMNRLDPRDQLVSFKDIESARGYISNIFFVEEKSKVNVEFKYHKI